MNTEQEDLFINWESLPVEVLELIDNFNEREQTYKTCKELLSDVNKYGYTFEYGLDAVPYNLQKL